MLNSFHNIAQELSVKAEEALRLGKLNESLELYKEAADSEFRAFNEIPKDKIKTRSVLAVSLSSLYYKAGLLADAEKNLFQLLGNEIFESWAEKQLRELLQVVSDEKLLYAQFEQRYSGDNITVSLRGGEIGSGTGPLDLILEKATGFKSLLYRFAEWVGKYPLRHKGIPSQEIISLIQARVTEPAIGSYRLEIKLTEPTQIEIFEKTRAKSSDVVDVMFHFFESLTSGDIDELQKTIPDEEYRKALLQLTRNISPGGKRIKEIGIYRKKLNDVQSIYLTQETPKAIKQVIPRKEKSTPDKVAEIKGTLRALHLDENWLEIHLPNGESSKFRTPHDLLDDVVGPMVNKEVLIRGTKNLWGKLLIEEIELIEGE